MSSLSERHVFARSARLLRAAAALAAVLVLSGASLAKAASDPETGKKSDEASNTAATAPAAPTAEEVQALREQLIQANKQIERLANIVDSLEKRLDDRDAATATAPAVKPATPVVATTTATAAKPQDGPTKTGDKDQKSTIDRLIAPKSEGGQFAGADGLYKTDRVKIGGYGDFRYNTRGIDEFFEIREEADELTDFATDSTNFRRSGFQMPRLVLGVAAALTDNLLFNSEIEYEFGGEEVDVEQAYLEYRLHPAFNLRGGIVVAPIGRFNLYHDSNLMDVTPRPLVSTLVIPSTYTDAGVGALGEFKLGENARLTYEGYVVNGLRSDESGEIAREAGLVEAKGLNKLLDNNGQRAFVGRLMVSPVLGLELGGSGYRGKHDDNGFYDLSIWALDYKYAYKGFQVIGEYARTAIQQGPESDETVAARNFLLALPDGVYTNTFDFIDSTINVPLFDVAPHSMDGFYIEGRYRFTPRWFTEITNEDGSIAPVIRFDRVNLDRDFPDFRFPLNQQRLTVGLSIRPTEAVGFNFGVHFNRDPDIDLRLPDNRPFPPYQTNIGATGFSMGWVWAF